MIRKMVLSASVVMMAATAFGAARERTAREEGRENSRAELSNSARVVDQNTLNLRQAVAVDAAKEGSQADLNIAGLITNPQAKGIDAAAQPKVDELVDRVAANQSSSSSVDEAVSKSLKEMGIDEQEFNEKCK